MKIAKRFTLNTAIIIVLLTVAVVIAFTYGFTLPEHSEPLPESSWELFKLRLHTIVTTPSLLADYTIYILSIVGFIAMLSMMLNIKQQLMKPVLAAVEFLKELADNKFPQKMPVPDKNNEMSELISSINLVRDSLQSTVLKLQTKHEKEKNARFSAEILSLVKISYVRYITPTIIENVDTIGNYLEILRRHDNNSPQSISTEEAFEGIQHSLQFVLRHIRRLAELNTFGSIKPEIYLEPVQVPDFIANIIATKSKVLDLRQIRLESEYHSNMPNAMLADPELLRSVLLIAINFIAENVESGESIHCCCYRSKEDVIFSIHDLKLTKPRTSMQELHEAIASSKENLSTTDSKLSALVVLQEWVESMNGRLEFTGDTPDCHFEIQLRFIDANIQESSTPSISTASRRLSSVKMNVPQERFEPIPAKILLAESNEHFCNSLKCLFESDKHTVHTAPTVEALTKAVNSDCYDLVIISLQMANSTYHDIMDQIRNNCQDIRTTIIAIHTEEMLQDEQWHNREVKYLLSRPIEFERLRQIAGTCRKMSIR